MLDRFRKLMCNKSVHTWLYSYLIMGNIVSADGTGGRTQYYELRDQWFNSQAGQVKSYFFCLSSDTRRVD